MLRSKVESILEFDLLCLEFSEYCWTCNQAVLPWLKGSCELAEDCRNPLLAGCSVSCRGLPWLFCRGQREGDGSNNRTEIRTKIYLGRTTGPPQGGPERGGLCGPWLWPRPWPRRMRSASPAWQCPLRPLPPTAARRGMPVPRPGTSVLPTCHGWPPLILPPSLRVRNDHRSTPPRPEQPPAHPTRSAGDDPPLSRRAGEGQPLSPRARSGLLSCPHAMDGLPLSSRPRHASGMTAGPPHRDRNDRQPTPRDQPGTTRPYPGTSGTASCSPGAPGAASCPPRAPWMASPCPPALATRPE